MNKIITILAITWISIMVLALLVFLIFSFVFMYQADVNHYTFYGVSVILTALLLTWGSFFWLDCL